MGIKHLNKNKGRIRDTVKQVLLIEGTPSFLYKGRERTLVDIKVDGHTYKLGMLGSFVNELRDIPKFEIVEHRITKYYPATIDLKGIGNRMTMRKVNGNTHLTVGASDEKQLYERINLLKEYLSSNGVDVKERCHWVCSIDKKQTQETKELLSSNVNKKEEIREIVPNKDIITETNTNKTNAVRILPEKTKKLRELTIKMGLAAVYDGVK